MLVVLVLILTAVVVFCLALLAGQRSERDRAVSASLDVQAGYIADLQRELTGVLARLAEVERRPVDREEPWSRPWEEAEE